MNEMKISLWPTADGCLRSPAVEQQARLRQEEGRTVVIASGDPILLDLKGVVRVRRIGDAWEDLLMVQSNLAVIDDLDFIDPDGQEIVSRQEGPSKMATSVSGDRFRSLLTRLSLNGTREVMLVSSRDAISPHWKDRHENWGVDIRWDMAKSDPWRSWVIGSSWFLEGDGVPPDNGGNGSRFLDPDRATIESALHSPSAQLLLMIAAEYADVVYCERTPRVAVDPMHILVQTMAGMPVADRLKHTGRLLYDLERLTDMGGELHRTLEGGAPFSGIETAVEEKVKRPKAPPARGLH